MAKKITKKKAATKSSTKKKAAAVEKSEPEVLEVETCALRPTDHRLPPAGTVLTKRDRHGNERARCTVVADGIEYEGAVYKSLSAAAIAAAKDLGLASKTQDGFAFWQLKKAAPRDRDLVAALERAWERYRERAVATANLVSDDDRAKVAEAIACHHTALGQLAEKVS